MNYSNCSRSLAVCCRSGAFLATVTLSVLLGISAPAQTFKVLHTFGGSDGGEPSGSLILSGNTLYGAGGTVFAINTDGSGFTNLHALTCGSEGGLTLSGGTLYGTTSYEGSSSNGTVFAVNIDGSGFTNLHTFTAFNYGTNSDGAYPHAGVILSGNTLYGTAHEGGAWGLGTLFAINTNGSAFTNLHSFNYSPDGAYPWAALISSGTTLFGTATSGGTNQNPDEGDGNGTVFKVDTDGAGFTVLHHFEAHSLPTGSNSDGNVPRAGLIRSGNVLFGTAGIGGRFNSGTVFAVNTDGTGFTNLHNFGATFTNVFGVYTNSDGIYPFGSLILSGNTLYGTAQSGGGSGNGTVYALNTDGTSFTTLHSFAEGTGFFSINSDGAYPWAGLILSGNTLYGTTSQGGSVGLGTIFSISFTPELTITASGPNLILTWPTDYVGFDYAGYTTQTATNLVSPVWTTNSPAPVVVNGQNTVTNPISGTQQFFRLSQ